MFTGSLYKCCHAAALFIYGIYNLSRTDVECSWKKKEFTNVPDISRKSIPEMFPLTRPGYTALLQQPNQGDLESSLACVSLSPESKQLGDRAVSTVEEQFFFRRISQSIYWC